MVVSWHRQGWRLYWRWKSQCRTGRPPIKREIRELVRRMAYENPLWSAPRIQGELLKLGLVIAETTVAKYMPKRDKLEMAVRKWNSRRRSPESISSNLVANTEI
jgi:putative transposase